MSVIFYEADELAALAALTVGNLASDQGKRDLARVVEDLAEYSRANAAAFRATYPGDPAEGITAQEIAAQVRPIHKAEQVRSAERVLAGLRYNLIANSGEDFATIRTLGLILECTQRTLRKPSRDDAALELRRVAGLIHARFQLESDGDESKCYPGAAFRAELGQALRDFDDG